MQNWVLFSLWLHLFILSGIISPLFSILEKHIGHILIWDVHLSLSYLFAFSYCLGGSQGKNTEMIYSGLSDLLYSLQLKMQRFVIFFASNSIQTAKTRPGANCGSDHELLITKFGLKLKKVGKTTRPFRYELSQIPYNYTVEVTNRFEGLDLVECLKNCGQTFVILYRRQ